MTQIILFTIVSTSLFYMLIWIVLGFASDFDYYRLAGGAMASFVIVTLITTIALNNVDFEPIAIDVYRGNTTLEITYKDSIPVDSTVVWK